MLNHDSIATFRNLYNEKIFYLLGIATTKRQIDENGDGVSQYEFWVNRLLTENKAGMSAGERVQLVYGVFKLEDGEWVSYE